MSKKHTQNASELSGLGYFMTNSGLNNWKKMEFLGLEAPGPNLIIILYYIII